MKLIEIGENYANVVFPKTYPIVGGDNVVNWIGLFCGIGFVFGWLPYTLLSIDKQENKLKLPAIVFIVFCFAVVIVTLLVEGLWRDIFISLYFSSALGMFLSIFENTLRRSLAP
ncbi:MAG: hypothetical protein QM730_13485 [Anaerolineales bacterium]